MGQEQSQKQSRISRRTYLGAIGAASATAGIAGVAGAGEGEYSTVVNIVEEGADDTGSEPIDDVFDRVKGDDTMVKFPEGTYRANELILYGLSHFAMVGDGATLVPGHDYNETVWLGGSEVRDLTVDGFTIDTTPDYAAPKVDISFLGEMRFRNVDKVGYHDGNALAFTFQAMNSDGHGYIENVSAPDGGDTVGMYLQGEGPMTVRNTHIEGFNDNGLYASHISAPVTVEGGHYRNNNIAQVRLGSADSVIRNARIDVTEDTFDSETVVNMRGIRIADGPGPVTVENCDITLSSSEGNGGIVTAYSGGSLVVRDTRIGIDESYGTTGSDGTHTSYAVFVDDATDAPSGSRTFENLSITGSGTYRGAMLIRRSDNTLDNVCIGQSGTTRNGIIFENSNGNSLTNSVVDVPDREVVLRDSSVKRANVSTSGSCPAPNSGGGSSPDDGLVDLPGQVGSVTHEQLLDEEWFTVGLTRQVEDPVVVSGPLSYAGWHPVHTRVRNVTPGSFDLQFEEWMYTDGNHRPETAHYAVLPQGQYDAGGLAAEVGTMETNHEFTSFSFDRSFDRQPVVLASTQTYNGDDPIVTRLQNVSVDGAEVRLQEEEAEVHGGYHYHETVGYLAVEPGTGSIGGTPFEVGAVDAHETWRRIDFSQSYTDPRFLAGIQTFSGPNTANVRYRNLTADGVEVFVEEEQSGDSETLHRYERVGFAVVDGV